MVSFEDPGIIDIHEFSITSKGIHWIGGLCIKKKWLVFFLFYCVLLLFLFWLLLCRVFGVCVGFFCVWGFFLDDKEQGLLFL